MIPSINNPEYNRSTVDIINYILIGSYFENNFFSIYYYSNINKEIILQNAVDSSISSSYKFEYTFTSIQIDPINNFVFYIQNQ